MGVTASLLMGSNADRIANSLEVIAIAQSKGIDGDVSFDGMAQLVKSGLGAKAFPVGTTINVAMETEITATVSGTGITDATVDDDVFISAEHEIGKTAYEFTYDGTAWRDSDGRVVDLDTYGISVTGTPVNGDAIVVHETAENVACVVMDHDYDTPVNSAIKRTLSFVSQNCIKPDGIVYDAPEALIYCPDGLAAGTRYYITLDHGAYNASTDQDGSYGFTPTQDVPEGGYVRHSKIGQTNLTEYTKSIILEGKFITYNTEFEQIEQLSTDEGTTGVFLGTASAIRSYMDPNYPNVNQVIRAQYGSGDWATSALRQYLNSEGTGWWKKQTVFDFPPANYTTVSGFLSKLDPALRANLQTVKKRYLRAPIDRGDGVKYVDVNDKVFMLGFTEVGFGSTDGGVYESSFGTDGELKTTPYAYYVGATSSDRIRLFDGAASTYRLRGNVPTTVGEQNTHLTRAVDPDGNVLYRSSNNTAPFVFGFVVG